MYVPKRTREVQCQDVTVENRRPVRCTRTAMPNDPYCSGHRQFRDAVRRLLNRRAMVAAR